MKVKRTSIRPLVDGICMALFFAILAACAQAPGQGELAGLKVSFPGHGISRGAYSFTAVQTWRIAGTGTGASFSNDFPGTATSARITDIYPGEWVITVDGLDASEVKLFTAKKTVTLVEGMNAITMTMVAVIAATTSPLKKR